jgi:hypothetical protein
MIIFTWALKLFSESGGSARSERVELSVNSTKKAAAFYKVVEGERKKWERPNPAASKLLGARLIRKNDFWDGVRIGTMK